MFLLGQVEISVKTRPLFLWRCFDGLIGERYFLRFTHVGNSVLVYVIKKNWTAMDYKTNGSLYVMRKVFESFRSCGIILAFPEVQIAARLSLSMSLFLMYSCAVRICARKF